MPSVVPARASGHSPTSGIQEAIDAMPAEGGVVLIPAGRYELRCQITLRSNITLRGEGDATVLSRGPLFFSRLAESMAAGSDRLRLAERGPLRVGDQIGIYSAKPPIAEFWNYKGFNMRYLQLQQVEPDGAAQGRKLFGRDDKDYRVEHEALAANIFPAIWAHDVQGVSIESLLIDGGFDQRPGLKDDADFMAAAVVADGATRCRLLNLTVRRWNADGICIGGKSADVLVQGCVVEHCHGIGLHTGNGIRSARLIANVSRHNDSGLLFCQVNRNVIVAHNHIHHNRGHGIWGLGDPDRYCIVAQNSIHDNGGHGIEATGGIGNVIQGNLCRNNSQSAAGKYAGIHLARHARNVVTGNLCLDDQPTPTQAQGISDSDATDVNLLGDNLALGEPLPSAG